MSEIWSVPIGILLVTAIIIFLINRRSQNIGAAWFFAIFAAFAVWGWTISLYFRNGIIITPLSESVPGLLEESGIFLNSGNGQFILDGISYPYMLAISALLVILLLTAPSYMEPKTAPRIWFFFLLTEAIGYLSVSTNNVKFVIYGWVIFDTIDLVTQYLQVYPNPLRRGYLTAIGIRFIGTLLAASCLSLSNAELGPDSGAFISLRAGAFLLTACALRMGILPISQPYGEMADSRVGLGTMLRLVSILTVMPVLSRIPLGGLRPDLRSLLGVAAIIASLAGAVGWLLSANSFNGISYVSLGVSGMAFICALKGDQVSLVVWGVSIALTCAPLSLYQIHHRFMNILVLCVVLCFSGLPYTPNAFGWWGLYTVTNPIQNVVVSLIPLFLISGSFIHIFRTEGRHFSDLEPWMRSVYPMGYAASIATHFLISTTQFGEPFSMGVIPMSVGTFVCSVLFTVLAIRMPKRVMTQNVAAWGRELLSVFWLGMKKLMDMEWLLFAAGWIRRFLEKVFFAACIVLENNGGIIWEFLLLSFLIAAAFSGEIL